MRRNLFDDVHEDFRASFRTFLTREVIGEDGRYGAWEREGIVPREVYELAGRGGFLAMAVVGLCALGYANVTAIEARS